MMRILITVNAAWNIWNFRLGLVRSLIADGHSITVLAPPDESVSPLVEIGCRFIPLDMSVKSLNPIDGIQLLRRFRKIFSAERPDVIFSFTIKNNIFGAIASRSLAIPFIPNVTGLGTAFLSSGLLKTAAKGLYRHAFRSCPTIFFQNEDDRELFLQQRLVRADQARLLPGSGIDLTRFAPAPMLGAEATPVLLMIARLLRDKGVLEFVEAARIVKHHYPHARFQLLGAIGSNNRTSIDAATVREWVQEGLIEYLGVTQDVRPFIADAACVVLPSYREGAPRTLIEAAAMARPLIATDVPGCRSVIDRDISGFLCEPRSAASLAAVLIRFLGLPPSVRSAMGCAGRLKMEREFDHSLVEAAYRNLLAAMDLSHGPRDA